MVNLHQRSTCQPQGSQHVASLVRNNEVGFGMIGTIRKEANVKQVATEPSSIECTGDDPVGLNGPKYESYGKQGPTDHTVRSKPPILPGFEPGIF